MPLIRHPAGHGGEGSALAAALKRLYHSTRNRPVPEQTNTDLQANTQSLRLPAVVLAVALLIGGVVLGHPDMSVADYPCTGYHDVGCSVLADCQAFCPTVQSAERCVAAKCLTVSGFCQCKIDPI